MTLGDGRTPSGTWDMLVDSPGAGTRDERSHPGSRGGQCASSARMPRPTTPQGTFQAAFREAPGRQRSPPTLVASTQPSRRAGPRSGTARDWPPASQSQAGFRHQAGPLRPTGGEPRSPLEVDIPVRGAGASAQLGHSVEGKTRVGTEQSKRKGGGFALVLVAQRRTGERSGEMLER